MRLNRFANYWNYMISLDTFGRLKWFAIMCLSTLFLIFLNSLIFRASKISGYLSLILIVFIYPPVHLSFVYSKNRKNKQ
jgi:hypothetical protein